jgi:hypothetical protein
LACVDISASQLHEHVTEGEGCHRDRHDRFASRFAVLAISDSGLSRLQEYHNGTKPAACWKKALR